MTTLQHDTTTAAKTALAGWMPPGDERDEILSIYDQLDPARQDKLAGLAVELLIEQSGARTGNIGAGVQAMREGLGVTVSELARAAGIRRPSIVAIERGRGTTADECHDIAAGIAWLVANPRKVAMA